MKDIVIQFGKRQKFKAFRALAFIMDTLKKLAVRQRPTIKQRYLRTSAGRLRARYSFMAILAAILSTYLMASTNWNQSVTLVRASNSNQTLASDIMDVAGLRDFAESKRLNTLEPAATMGMAGFAILPPAEVAPEKVEPKEWSKKVAMEKGGTLGGLLEKNEVGAGDAFKVVKAMGEYVDPRDLKPGQHIVIHYERDENNEQVFAGMDVIKSGIETVEIRRSETDQYGFSSTVQKEALYTETRSARVTVSSSIYANLAAADVPDGIINQFIRSLSWSIDFQRDIWGGEEIEVLYTVRKNKDESYLRSDELLYANLISKGQKRPIYLFTKQDGDQDYFDDKGQSVRKALLKTPVDGARVSSGYGMRTHPVLGYSKMHKGLDFAAPTGTPIYAAGKGIVERADRFSSYGNYIRIRHNNTYSTAYAHLHKFAKGVKKGTRVKQGQIIGYVGSTGRSTGPHLHYEVIVNGKQVNPRSMKLPIGETLSGTNLANFKIRKDKLDEKFRQHLSAPSQLVKISTN